MSIEQPSVRHKTKRHTDEGTSETCFGLLYIFFGTSVQNARALLQMLGTPLTNFKEEPSYVAEVLLYSV